MVRPPSFDRNGIKRGAWSEEEDNKLRTFVQRHGHPNWRLLPSSAGLARCGKSCRLRWVNYLQPGLIKGNFTKEEEDLIIRLHNQHGNKWSFIANKLAGRTDNDIKNHWHAHIKKRNLHVVTRSGAQIKKPNQEEETITPKNPEIITHTAINVGQDENMVAQAQGDIWTKAYHQLPPFPEEEFPDFDLCHNDTSDSSHGGITYDHTCFTQLKIDLPPLVGNEFFDFGVCPNDMSTFSDSSEGGITSQSDSTTVESDGSFWSECMYGDDTIDMVLWQ